jgi:hypothetical protein
MPADFSLPICPVCSTPSFDCGPELFRCPKCDHIFQHPPVISCAYGKAYTAARADAYETTPLLSHLRLGFVLGVFGDSSRPFPTVASPGVVEDYLLDVGYGNGSFLKLAAKCGFNVCGKEVHGVDYGIREAKFTEAEWDLVTFFDSLEHFADLNEVRKMNAKRVVVSVPARPASFPADLNWKHYRPGEHLHYFSKSSLEEFFGPFDLELLHVSYFEDIVRGKLSHGEANILTCAFQKDWYSQF